MPLFLSLLAVAAAVSTPSRDDPRGLLPTVRPAVVTGAGTCGEVPGRPLTLPDLVDLALCRNPQTAVSWASVRAAAAQVGVARSAYLPSIDLDVGPTLSRSDSFGGGGGFVGNNGQIIGGSAGSTNFDTSARIAVNYLLLDFGGRRARVDAAAARQVAALAQYADAGQEVVLNVVSAYNSLAANRAIEVANQAQIEFARVSRDFAAGRQRAGVATGADRLQAETALSQAELALIRTRANTATAAAQLAVAVGLPPTSSLALAPAAPLATGALLAQGAAALIAEAERLRPDIAAARANAAAAEAQVRAERAAGRPSIAASASNQLAGVDTRIDRNFASVGVSLSVPIFSGWNRRYTIAAARAEAERAAAVAEQTRQQAGLAVYSNYVGLEASLASLATARVLIESATASADIAQGRYRAGVGTFADLLNAQSALADARQQLVQSEFDVRTANAQLARAVGGIGEAVR